MDASVIKQAQR